MPIIGFFLSASKTATLTQYFDHKMVHFCPKQGSIDHKKFRRFQKSVKILSETATSFISQKPA